MKLLKSTGLVLGLVLVATAFLAVGSASAETTKLCKVNEEKCSKANTWGLSFENFKGAIGASPEGAKLVMPGLVTVSCPTGKLASTLKETTKALVGEVSKWNTFNCTPAGTACTLLPPKEIETGYSAEVEATGGGNGVLYVGLGPTLIVNCTGSLKITCTYTTPTMKFTIKGGPGGGAGKNPQISSEAPMTRVATKSHPLCPTTATYVSLYQIVEPGFSTFVTN
jgi:hypothetical protein